MSKSMLFTCLLSLLLTSHLGLAKNVVYKKINEDGSVTYSDKPLPGAIEIVIEDKATIIPSAPIKPVVIPQASVERKNYKLNVTNPENEATVLNNSGNFTISARVEPESGGMYTLKINGDSYQSASGTFTLQNMDRGEYNYKVTFTNQSGKIIASSADRKVFLRRNSVLFNSR